MAHFLRFGQWRQEQLRLRDHVVRVLRHVGKRATPPPKAFWVPPCGVNTLIRLALKTLNSLVVSDIDFDLSCHCHPRLFPPSVVQR